MGKHGHARKGAQSIQFFLKGLKARTHECYMLQMIRHLLARETEGDHATVLLGAPATEQQVVSCLEPEHQTTPDNNW
jgi:hypothetical protein